MTCFAFDSCINSGFTCVLCSKENVREVGKRGLIPQVAHDEDGTVTPIPMFSDVVGYLHKRVS